jgi:non-heme chloroperoxidase
MDAYADDLAAVIEALDLRGAVLVGFSTGGGEVARYIGRHGTERVAGAVLVSAVPPYMLKTDDNPGGVPLEVFDGLRAGSVADRAQLYRDLAEGPFFGNNRPGPRGRALRRGRAGSVRCPWQGPSRRRRLAGRR